MIKSKVELIVYKERQKMNKLPESLCKELNLSVEAKERLNDYMEKTISNR